MASEGPKHGAWRVTWVAATCVLLSACGSRGGTSLRMASERPPARSCTLVFNESALAECKDAALLRRDPKAAIAVARYYDGPLQGDRVAALDWYERAADLGSTEAFRKLFDAYYFGWHAPK